ncbi:thioredoxin-dependent thiol peroxidase [Pasteuria penetrans]|uniref:thioredoxin-dependent thiol peroxidase n=1 Tax=Pasteuria penetrans TaxID=86005 RepID=UPI000F995B86|nr:thioredoxin-dependent thiol peroxidase [Pasteuria penetrans]
MLRTGDQAPDFTLPAANQEGEISLSDFRGCYVLLYFYPKNDTPNCTTEACAFRDQNDFFSEFNTVIIGISRDSVASHERFAKRYHLPFLLLSDQEGGVCSQYGVLKERKLFGKAHKGIVRTTFLIDPEGKIVHVYDKVKVEGHADEIIHNLRDLVRS